MLRAILLLIALAILVVIALAYTGIISLNQTQQGQAPKFQVDVQDIDVGTTTRNVQVPAVEMKTKQIEVPSVTVGGAEDGNSAE